MPKGKYNNDYYQVNKERIAAANRRYKQKNRFKVAAINSAWYEENKEHKSAYSSEYKRNNKPKVNNIAAKRRAAERSATPLWLTEVQYKEIEEMYKLAHELAWLNQDGKPFDVDHIIPLQSPNVCGLHVPWNLQLLPFKDNRKKRNKLLHLV